MGFSGFWVVLRDLCGIHSLSKSSEGFLQDFLIPQGKETPTGS